MFGSHSFGLTGLSQWRTGAGVFRTSCERGVTVSRKRSCIAPPPRHNLAQRARACIFGHLRERYGNELPVCGAEISDDIFG